MPEAEAAKYVNAATEPPERHVPDVKAALDGARQILMERFSEDAALLEKLRGYLNEHALIVSAVVEGKEEAGAKFRDWFDFRERIADVPSHRALAMFRGRNEDMLRLALKTEHELAEPPPGSGPNLSPCVAMIAGHFGIADQGRAADRWLLETARWTWLVKLSLHLELELMNALRERAEEEAIRVFARNLHDLLLAAPAGPRVTLGLDPGIRTGVQGGGGRCDRQAARHGHALSARAAPRLGGLAGRPAPPVPEAWRQPDRHRQRHRQPRDRQAGRRPDETPSGTAPRQDRRLRSRRFRLFRVGTGGGANFPTLDVSLRGAVSIARRLQDPLAELVKIDPKSIGVGQYQHDVNQGRLAQVARRRGGRLRELGGRRCQYRQRAAC